MKCLVNVKPPKGKISWFFNNFRVGDNVELVVNLGLQGIKKINGTVKKLEEENIVLEKENVNINSIIRVTNLKNFYVRF